MKDDFTEWPDYQTMQNMVGFEGVLKAFFGISPPIY